MPHSDQFGCSTHQIVCLAAVWCVQYDCAAGVCNIYDCAAGVCNIYDCAGGVCRFRNYRLPWKRWIATVVLNALTPSAVQTTRLSYAHTASSS